MRTISIFDGTDRARLRRERFSRIFSRTLRVAGIVFLAACCAAALWYSIVHVAKFPHWIVDDAFINFRYAQNLTEHGELNWNPGENPVEGYTGVALVWMIAMAMKLGISPVAAVHFIGLFFYFFGAGVLVLAFRGINLSSASALVLYLTAPFFFSHAWAGLETTMFVSMMMLAICAFARRRQRLFVASILLLSLTRPEGILLSVILLALYRPFSRSLALLYLVPFGLYYLWRWGYYGKFFPNTFYAKLSADAEELTLPSLRRFFSIYLAIPLLLAFIAASREKMRKHVRIIVGVAVFIAVCLGVYLSSRLVMNYAYRFFVPFYALTLLALGGALYRERFDAKVFVIVLALVIPQVLRNMDKDRLKDMTEYAKTHYGMLQEEHIPAGRFLSDTVPADQWLVVHSDAGAIPYYSGLKVIDCGRLNSEYLTNTDLTPAEVCDYLYSHDPAAFAMTSRRKSGIEHGPEAAAIARDPRFAGYRLVKRYGSLHRKRYFEFVYLRNELADSLGLEGIDASVASAAPNEQQEAILTQPGSPETLEDLRQNVVHRGLDDDLSGRTDLDTADKLWEYAQKAKERSTQRTALERFVREYKDDPRIPEALWALSMTIDEPMERIAKLRRICDTFPENENAPKALFMIGFLYSEEIKDAEKAREYFTRCIELYPGTESAETAKAMLDISGVNAPKFE